DHMHAEHCLAALAAGKHVICTKPMVTSLADARELVRAVRRSGKKFLVGQTMRFDRQFLTLRQFFERGDLGKLRVAQAHYVRDMRPIYQLTPWRLKVPQDLMYGGIVHVADILRSFCGEATEVHAFANHGTLTPEYPMEDNYLLNLRFESGVIGQGVGLYGLVHPPMPMMQVSLFGTCGSAISDFTDNEPGTLRVTLDALPVHEPLMMQFPPEKDTSSVHLTHKGLERVNNSSGGRSATTTELHLRRPTRCSCNAGLAGFLASRRCDVSQGNPPRDRRRALIDSLARAQRPATPETF